MGLGSKCKVSSIKKLGTQQLCIRNYQKSWGLSFRVPIHYLKHTYLLLIRLCYGKITLVIQELGHIPKVNSPENSFKYSSKYYKKSSHSKNTTIFDETRKTKVIKEKWGQYFAIDHFCTPLCSKRNGNIVIKKFLEQKFAKSSVINLVPNA